MSYVRRKIKSLLLYVLQKITRIYVKYFDHLYLDTHKNLNIYRINKSIDGRTGKNIRINGKTFISSPEKLVLGNNVHIGNGCFLYSNGGLVIGDNTHLSRNITIYTSNHNYQGEVLPYDNSDIIKPVLIGKNVWIGMNVNIIPNIKIGDGAIIGLGSVVTVDVPDLAIVGGNPAQIIGYRDEGHYSNLDNNKKYGGVNGLSINEKELEIYRINAVRKKNNLFFIASSGRSGSTSIAHLLNQHKSITCLHETKKQLVRIDTEYIHQEKSKENIINELNSIYNTASFIPNNGVYGESDHKLSNLIELINEVSPECKFIWLIRNGKDVVASTHGWKWFSEEEKKKGEFYGGGRDDVYQWYYYRLNGGICDPSISSERWEGMSAFEKNCWYWNFINTRIRKQLEKLQKARYLIIKLEELHERQNDIFKFLVLLSNKILKLFIPIKLNIINIPKTYGRRRKKKYLICGAVI